jgi:hypothetical protein
MPVETTPRPSAAPAVGLFGGGRAEPTALPAERREPTATQKKSFADLFRADGSELHAA